MLQLKKTEISSVELYEIEYNFGIVKEQILDIFSLSTRVHFLSTSFYTLIYPNGTYHC